METPVPPKLVGEIENYNVIKYNDKFFAVAQGIEDIDFERFVLEEYALGEAFVGDNWEQLEKDVAEHRRHIVIPPELIGEIENYNVLSYNHRFYAVYQGIVGFDFERFERGEYTGGEAFVGDNWEQLGNEIAEYRRCFVIFPELVGQIENYNILSLDHRFYAVFQGVVNFDYKRFVRGEYGRGEVFVGDNLEQLEKDIAEHRRRFIMPQSLVNVRTNTAMDEFSLPEVIELEPMEKCNLRCFMCPQSYDEVNIGKSRIDVLFLKNMRGLEGKLVTMGANNEPTTHPQFAEICQGLTDLGMTIDLTTNGTMFTDGLIERLKDCRFSNLIFSVDGMSKETFEYVRTNANWERTMERILNFRNTIVAADPTVFSMVQFILMRSTLPEVEAALDFWAEQGFDHIGYLGMVVGRKTELLERESISDILPETHAALRRAAERLIKERYRITMSASFVPEYGELLTRYPINFVGNNVRSDKEGSRLPFNARVFFQNGPYPGMDVDCRSPFKYVRIYYDGTVRLCGQFVIGDIYEKPFVDIWYGEEAEKVRSRLMEGPDICYQCDYYRHCLCAGSNEADVEESRYFGEALLDDYKPIEIHNETNFSIISWRGKYYGVPRVFESFDVRLEKHPLVIEGTDLSDILEKMKNKPKVEWWLIRTPRRLIGALRRYYRH